MVSWPDKPSPMEATAQWHTAARERDEEYLAQGPVDMTETTDGPWSGPDPDTRQTRDPADRLEDLE